MKFHGIHPKQGAYACGCRVPGWTVDVNGGCKDVDECATDVAECTNGKFCVNEIGKEGEKLES